MNSRTATATVVEISRGLEVSRHDISTVSVTKPLPVSMYETRRWLYWLALPVMWLLTLWVMSKKGIRKFLKLPDVRTNSLWFDGLCPELRKVKEGAASWKALDQIYNWRFNQGYGLGDRLGDFWFGMINAQSVRNRFKLVKEEVRRAIIACNGHQEVRILSLACGSAQAIIELIAEFKSKGSYVSAMLLDQDQTALDYAQVLAHRYGVSDRIQVVNATVFRVSGVAKTFKPQIIEMLGLLDYLPYPTAVKLISKIQEVLPPKGFFLTCNIMHNSEQHFLKWVINWPMIYRTPQDMAEIVSNGGFNNVRLVSEPLKLHVLAVVQKEDTHVL